MRRLRPIWLCLALVLAWPLLARAQTRAPWGDGESRGEDLKVLLITFGPGAPTLDRIYEWWGHGAIAIEDTRLQQSRLYNFGMFDFRNFDQFALGRLEFWVEEDNLPLTLSYYASEDRDVVVQELNLSPEARLAIGQRLSDNVLPENKRYLYHHYFDNCATRLRDAIDFGIGGQLKAQEQGESPFTLREETRRFTQVSEPMSALLDFMMNDSIDQRITRWDEAFLPEVLGRQVAAATYVDAQGKRVPLVARTTVIHQSRTLKPVPANPPHDWPWLFGLGLFFGGLAMAFATWARRGSRLGRVLYGLESSFIGLFAGLPGTVLLLMWLFTNHEVTFHNENVMLANPLTLGLIPIGLAVAFGSKKAPRRLLRLWQVLAGLAALLVVLKVLPWFDQQNGNILALFLPLIAGCTAGAFALARQPSTQPVPAEAKVALGK